MGPAMPASPVLTTPETAEQDQQRHVYGRKRPVARHSAQPTLGMALRKLCCHHSIIMEDGEGGRHAKKH